jgi:hypothetical protein
MGRRLSEATMAIALALTSGVARGSTTYPDLIQQHLGLSCTPACTICHSNPNGGYGTVTTAFGHTTMSFGLVAASPNALLMALDEDRVQHLDSDGDGDTDIDALIACRDPNQPNAGDAGKAGNTGNTNTDPIPVYGCAVGRGVGRGLGAVAIAVAGLFLVRRGRRSLRGAGRKTATAA